VTFELALVIKTTVVLVVAGMATALMRRASAATRHAVWALALLSLLAEPAVILLLPRMARLELPLLAEETAISSVLSPVMLQQPPARSSVAERAAGIHREATQPIPQSTRGPLRAWIYVVWVAGVLLAFTRLLLAVLKARLLARQSESTVDEEWIALISHLRRELSISSPVDVRIGGDMPPMAFGLTRPVILLPSAANTWTEDRRHAVLAHELAHVRRRDGLVQILVQLACSLYWFNPAVWYAERRMRLESERACDDHVLNLGVGAVPYAGHLVELVRAADSGSTLATVSMALRSQLERRLKAILAPHLKRNRLSSSNAAFVVLCVSAVALGLGAVQVTSLLSLTLPVLAGPAVPVIVTSPAVHAPLPVQAKGGTLAGRVLWTDGAAAAGARVSAIEITEPNPGNREWVAGETVAASTIADTAGRYRIENLPPARYHIVTGPVYLPRYFSDVVTVDSPHLVRMVPAGVVENVDFEMVRNPDRLPFVRDRVLTVTGKLEMKRFGSSGGGVYILVANSDGSITKWHFRRPSRAGRIEQRMYWWPAYDMLSYGTSPMADMVNGGETVTVTGVEWENWGRTNPALNDARALNPIEVTRGGP